VAETITITDDRTGKQVTVPIDNGTIPSSALRQLDPDLRVYDPALWSRTPPRVRQVRFKGRGPRSS